MLQTSLFFVDGILPAVAYFTRMNERIDFILSSSSVSVCFDFTWFKIRQYIHNNFIPN